MRASEAIKGVLAEQGRSQRSLALELGITPQGLDQRLRSESMKVGTLCEMAQALGYRVQLVPKDGGSAIAIEG